MLVLFQRFLSIAFLLSSSAHSQPLLTDWTIPGVKQAALNSLKMRRDQVRSWASLCREGQNLALPSPYGSESVQPYVGQFSASLSNCGQGDLMIFGGFSGFSAFFAGDMDWAMARHEEQRLSQEPSGRWVRGPSWVGKELADNAFSRDQATGLRLYFVIGLERIAREKHGVAKEQLRRLYADQLYRWLKWMETEGNGRMCRGDQRCDVLGLVGADIYRIAQILGVLNSETSTWKIVQRMKVMKNTTGGSTWASETAFTPIDYQMLLKMADFLIQSYLGDYDEFWLHAGARAMSDKDPGHTLYSFLANGLEPRQVQEILYQCPAQAPASDGVTFQFMHLTKNRAWKKTNGHACLLLLNFMIAEMEGNLKWLKNKHAVRSNACTGQQTKVGQYGEWPICESDAPEIRSRCLAKHTLWKNSAGEDFCLKRKDGFYLAQKISRDCPLGFEQVGVQVLNSHEWPQCMPKNPVPISEVGCSVNQFVWAGRATDSVIFQGENFCAIPRTGYYSIRPVTRICPVGQKFLGTHWGDWPVCGMIGALPVSKERCVEGPIPDRGWQYQFHSPITGKNYCILQKDLSFGARPLR